MALHNCSSGPVLHTKAAAEQQKMNEDMKKEIEELKH